MFLSLEDRFQIHKVQLTTACNSNPAPSSGLMYTPLPPT